MNLIVGDGAIYNRAFLSTSSGGPKLLRGQLPPKVKEFYILFVLQSPLHCCLYFPSLASNLNSCPVTIPKSKGESVYLANNVHSLVIVGAKGAGKTRLAQAINYKDRKTNNVFISISRHREYVIYLIFEMCLSDLMLFSFFYRDEKFLSRIVFEYIKSMLNKDNSKSNVDVEQVLMKLTHQIGTHIYLFILLWCFLVLDFKRLFCSLSRPFHSTVC